MKKSNKHYKFINCSTGHAIYYHSVSDDLETKKVKEELEKVRAKVAVNNGIYLETVYWEEIKEEA
jgi:formylmethanofuran:tetrahydromethanopterin formyltransferase